MSAAAAMRLTQLHGEPRSTLVGPAHARDGTEVPGAYLLEIPVTRDHAIRDRGWPDLLLQLMGYQLLQRLEQCVEVVVGPQVQVDAVDHLHRLMPHLSRAAGEGTALS